jgi:hypothetical protein
MHVTIFFNMKDWLYLHKILVLHYLYNLLDECNYFFIVYLHKILSFHADW